MISVNPSVTEPKVVVTKDIIRRVKLRSNIADNIFSYDPYDIKDGERPDILAHQFYDGTSKLAWVILITNEIHDLYEDTFNFTRPVQKHITTIEN